MAAFCLMFPSVVFLSARLCMSVGLKNCNSGCRLEFMSLSVCAGSERVGRSEATGDRLEEAKHINRSLSALGDVMAALAQSATLSTCPSATAS